MNRHTIDAKTEADTLVLNLGKLLTQVRSGAAVTPSQVESLQRLVRQVSYHLARAVITDDAAAEFIADLKVDAKAGQS